MGTRVRNIFAMALLFNQSSWGLEADFPITLRINEQTDVPRAARDEARREIRRIFGKAGIEALWLDCPAARPGDAACGQRHRQRDLVIRILGGLNTSRTGHDFGWALIVREGFSRYASVFLGEITAVSDGEAEFEGRVLGYTIAHEVGHLLLGSDTHSSAGIMTTRWDRKVIRRAPRKSFSFTKKQAEQMRANVRARLAAETGALQSSESPVNAVK